MKKTNEEKEEAAYAKVSNENLKDYALSCMLGDEECIQYFHQLKRDGETREDIITSTLSRTAELTNLVDRFKLFENDIPNQARLDNLFGELKAMKENFRLIKKLEEFLK